MRANYFNLGELKERAFIDWPALFASLPLHFSGFYFGINSHAEVVKLYVA